MYKHYSPRCKTFLFKAEEIEKVKAVILQECENGKVGVLCENALLSSFDGMGATLFDFGATAENMATNLYKLLRQAENQVETLVAIEPMAQGGVMDGVMNRLKKACLSTDISNKS